MKNDAKLLEKQATTLLAEVVRNIRSVVEETKENLDFMRFLALYTK